MLGDSVRVIWNMTFWEREREREWVRERVSEREWEKEREWVRERMSEWGRQTDRQTDRQTERVSEREWEKEREWVREREWVSERERETDRQTDWDRETDRQREEAEEEEEGRESQRKGALNQQSLIIVSIVTLDSQLIKHTAFKKTKNLCTMWLLQLWRYIISGNRKQGREARIHTHCIIIVGYQISIMTGDTVPKMSMQQSSLQSSLVMLINKSCRQSILLASRRVNPGQNKKHVKKIKTNPPRNN